MIENNFGFIILCPSMNYGGLRTTVSTINSNFPDTPITISIAESVNKKDIIEINKIANTVVGKPTITALINNGIKQAEKPWNMTIISGSYVRYETIKKYRTFIKKETDIGYPIVNLKSWRFEESSLNGFFVHKNTFDTVGPFAEDEHSLEIIRLFWALDAVERGCQLKGIVGVKIC